MNCEQLRIEILGVEILAFAFGDCGKSG